MIISLNWLKKYVQIDLPVDELATLIGARLVEIEKIIDLGKKYQGALVVEAVSVKKLENSDHLSVVMVNDGGVLADIERDENGLVQVVCGANNIADGQKVVWLTPGMVVPDTYDKPEQFVLGSRKLCGVMSNGMIASARELDLYDEHDGILVLDNEIQAGKTFAESYELNDYLIDIENKSLTHRPDCFGLVGFAREVAGILGKKFETPKELLNLSSNINLPINPEVQINAIIDDKNLSARYTAIVMSGADGSKQSPLLIQTYLSRVGIRPISAVVDVTNYLMVLTGQPLHAFDYDKVVAVSGGSTDIHVRAGRLNEKLLLLDGRLIELTTNDIVIAAGEKAIGLAGAMGGKETEIDNNTKRIIIESATFNLYNLRNTQMRFGIFSEAITRFTKGQPAELSMPVLNIAAELMNAWTGASCISKLADAYPEPKIVEPITVDSEKINNILGTKIDPNQIVEILQNVGFEISRVGNYAISTKSPYWRSDIHIIEDLAEEVGRLSGFDNISPVLPRRDFTATKPSDFDDFRRKVRKILTNCGCNEVLTYSFIHGDVLKKSNQDPKNSYRIINSISPDLQYYRQSITPSLLGLVFPNIKQGFDKFSLYEINKTHTKIDNLNEENVPIESDRLAMIFADKNTAQSAPYYSAKRVFDYIAEKIGADISYVSFTDEIDAVFAPFEPKRSAKIIDKHTELLIGVIGEYKKSVTKSFKVSENSSGFEVDLVNLFTIAKGTTKNYKPISKYPATSRDICFQVNDNVSYASLVDVINDKLSKLEYGSKLSPVDIYKPEASGLKNITIRIEFVSYEKTLTSEEINAVINDIGDSAIKNIDALIL